MKKDEAILVLGSWLDFQYKAWFPSVEQTFARLYMYATDYLVLDNLVGRSSLEEEDSPSLNSHALPVARL